MIELNKNHINEPIQKKALYPILQQIESIFLLLKNLAISIMNNKFYIFALIVGANVFVLNVLSMVCLLFI